MASINEVAALAKVSISTVSRVMNNQPRVAPETAKAVRNAMQQLGYTLSERRPGPKPQLSVSTTITNIGFLVFGTSESRATPAFEGLLYGVSMAASQANLNMVFSHVPDPDRLPARIADQGISGFLLHGAAPSPAVQARLQAMPCVWLMGNRHRPAFGDKVMPDAYVVGETAARYLLKRGHRRLAFLNMNPGHWPFRVYAHAFSITAEESGAAVDVLQQAGEETGAYRAQLNPQAVEKLVDAFVALPERPTGIFVADDSQVAMLQPALQARGVTIGPGAVEIVSCNDEQPYLAGLSPKPATIDIQVAALGRRGVEQLIWRMANRDVLERVTCMVEPTIAVPGQTAWTRGASKARRSGARALAGQSS